MDHEQPETLKVSGYLAEQGFEECDKMGRQ